MYLGRKDKNPLEEVKNTLHPTPRTVEVTPAQTQRRRKLDVQSTPRPNPTPIRIAALETPMSRPSFIDFIPSAMKGVVLTSTGESLDTPAPTTLSKLFDASPKVGLNFTKIFDFDEGEKHLVKHQDPGVNNSPPPSPTSRKEKERAKEREKDTDDAAEGSGSSTSSTAALSTTQSNPPPTRLRRPSIRASRTTHNRSTTLPTSVSEPAVLSTPSGSATLQGPQPKPLPHPHLRPSKSNSNLPQASVPRATEMPIPVPKKYPSPEYDLADEENLPSPFLKRIDRVGPVKPVTTNTTSSSSASVSATKLKRNSGLLLRAVAAANNVGRRSATTQVEQPWPEVTDSLDSARPSLASARKASEEARKALSRP